MQLSKWIVLGIIILQPLAAHADGLVHARSDVTAEVVLNGQLMGTTPLDIARLQPGSHEIRLHALGRDDYKVYSVSVPAGVHSESTVAGSFGPQVVVIHRPAPRPIILEQRVVQHSAIIVNGRGVKAGHYRGRGRRRHW